MRTRLLTEQQLQKRSAHENRLLRRWNERQHRVTVAEKKERAAFKRELVGYECRANLLQCLNANCKALERSRVNRDLVRMQAKEEIARSKERGRRVRSCKVIQRFVRERFGWRQYCVERIELSELAAVSRLQSWVEWRCAVCAAKFTGDDSAVEALRRLVHVFVREEDGSRPSFEEIRVQMMNPETMETVNQVLKCLRPAIVASATSKEFASRGKQAPLMDTRTVLSLLLVAVCPQDVLGDYKCTEEMIDPSKSCARLLVKAANRLLKALRNLSLQLSAKVHSESVLKSSPTSSFNMKILRSAVLSSSTLFDLWKEMDLEALLAGMKVQLEQSWVIYLSSTKTLKYLAECTNVDDSTSLIQDDPLTALRLRHEASHAGSRGHIKRVRASLDKLVGCEEAKQIITTAKTVALEEMARKNCVDEMCEEVNVMLGRGVDKDAENTPAASPRLEVESSSNHEQNNHQLDPQLSALPAELVSNVQLVHRILLTDSQDFDKLSWDGSDARTVDVTVEEFMQSFHRQSSASESADVTSVMQASICIAKSMKAAFFNNIAIEMERGNFDLIKDLITELHEKMRVMLPNRQDLHSHVDDVQVANVSSIADIIQLLIRCGSLLSSYLESPARTSSTRELVQCLEKFNRCEASEVSYGIESTNLFVVACAGFLLHKAEMTQMDISNYKLASVAPILHHVGHDYERRQFQSTFGDFEDASIETLQSNLPATWDWIKDIKSTDDGVDASTLTSFEQMDLVKSRGFVDGVLFNKNPLALPEIFTLDAGSIGHIRSEARCCVIASALVLHACKTSKTPTSILTYDYIPEEVSIAKDVLSSALRKSHGSQDALKICVVHAMNDLAEALVNRKLDEPELESMRNHAVAVLQGSDPVLKLLDKRVRSFFSFACKWVPNSSISSMQHPTEMKTGQPLIGEEAGIKNNGIPSTKHEFTVAAQKEATRLGFAFFKSDLVDAGDASRRMVGLACSIYGRDVLCRFLSVQNGD